MLFDKHYNGMEGSFVQVSSYTATKKIKTCVNEHYIRSLKCSLQNLAVGCLTST